MIASDNKLQRLYASDHLEMALDHNTNILHCRWIGFQPHERVVAGGGLMLDMVRAYKVIRIVNDNRLVRGSWWDAAGWAAEVWFPQMFDAGLQQFGWILSPNIFAELSARKAMNPYPDKVQPFHAEDQAAAWVLRELQQKINP